MPYGLKLAVFGLLAFAAALLFGSRESSTDTSHRAHVKTRTQRVTIYPNGGSNGPGGGG
jgi:hypothetical protein